MPTLGLLLGLLVATLTVSSTCSSAILTKSWTLYHAVVVTAEEDPVVFVPRGRIHMALPTAGTADTLVQMTVDNTETVAADMMQSLLRTGAWYQLKLVPDDDTAVSSSIVTSVPACHVRRANLRDEFVVTVNHDADIINMAYMPLVSPLAPSTCDSYSDNSNESAATAEFSSKISLETATPGMHLRTVLPEYQPPTGMTLLYGNKMGGDGTNGSPNNNNNKDNNTPPVWGFVRKYWYIILPLILAQFLTGPESATRPAGSAAGTATAAPPGSGGTPIAAAAAPETAGAPRRRRGKRG
jgi:hypothetical protein